MVHRPRNRQYVHRHKFLELCNKMFPKNNINVEKYLTTTEQKELEKLIQSEMRAVMSPPNKFKESNQRLLTLKKINLLLLKVQVRQNKKKAAKHKKNDNED